MDSNNSARASARVAKSAPWTSPFFRLAKNDSTGALSQRFARRLMPRVIPWADRSRW
jgi:hypothetical protein